MPGNRGRPAPQKAIKLGEGAAVPGEGRPRCQDATTHPPRRHPHRLRRPPPGQQCRADPSATLALHLGLPQLVDRHLDLGRATGRANTGDKMMTLVASVSRAPRNPVGLMGSALSLQVPGEGVPMSLRVTSWVPDGCRAGECPGLGPGRWGRRSGPGCLARDAVLPQPPCPLGGGIV